MQRTKPPFRADHVGSLLRSAALKQARARRQRGDITAAELKAVEDREIAALIKKQEQAGLKSITVGFEVLSGTTLDQTRALVDAMNERIIGVAVSPK